MRRDDLGDMTRSIVDHAGEMVRGKVQLGVLEARRSLARTAPRVALGAAAMVLGLAAFVFAAIAIFMGLGALIASVAGRLAIYAGVFGAAAVVSALVAKGVLTKPHTSTMVVSASPPSDRVVPLRPLDTRERGGQPSLERPKPAPPIEVTDRDSRPAAR
jgi:hypothetical protein